MKAQLAALVAVDDPPLAFISQPSSSAAVVPHEN